MTIQAVDDVAEISVVAADEHLTSCPVESLIHTALDHYLVQRKFRHKLRAQFHSGGQQGRQPRLLQEKVGFEPRPVHRAFVLHPLVAPFANRLTLWALRSCTRLRPGSRACARPPDCSPRI